MIQVMLLIDLKIFQGGRAGLLNMVADNSASGGQSWLRCLFQSLWTSLAILEIVTALEVLAIPIGLNKLIVMDYLGVLWWAVRFQKVAPCFHKFWSMEFEAPRTHERAPIDGNLVATVAALERICIRQIHIGWSQ